VAVNARVLYRYKNKAALQKEEQLYTYLILSSGFILPESYRYGSDDGRRQIW